MKTDIDQLMEAHNVDALMVLGASQHNPYMVYFTGVRHVTNADLVKKKGEAPILFHGVMERDEALKTGLKTRSYNDYPLAPLLKQARGNPFRASVLRYQEMLTDAGVTGGHVLLYGEANIGTTYSTFSRLRKLMPEIAFSGDLDGMILPVAMMTKDADEISHIRQMGKITTEVVARVAEFLTSHAAKDGRLVKDDGTPLQIKDVKSRINLWLAELGAENPEGTIFSIGRDAGVPHSSGNPEDFLRLGQTIVFDIYPCEAGGGYFYDFTRTWCLGYAPDEVVSLYDDVHSVYSQTLQTMKANERCLNYQQAACEWFESHGHPTILSTPATEEGYIHSLGHGVGLYIHEKPFSGATSNSLDRLAPGVVFTVEPGLYYPSKGMGVRLEDSIWVNPQGQIEVLAPYPLDLVLPIRKQL